jgi:hypothetical protein
VSLKKLLFNFSNKTLSNKGMGDFDQMVEKIKEAEESKKFSSALKCWALHLLTVVDLYPVDQDLLQPGWIHCAEDGGVKSDQTCQQDTSHP